MSTFGGNPFGGPPDESQSAPGQPSSVFGLKNIPGNDLILFFWSEPSLSSIIGI